MARHCIECGKKKTLFARNCAGLAVNPDQSQPYRERVKDVVFPGNRDRDFLCVNCANTRKVVCSVHGNVPWSIESGAPICNTCCSEDRDRKVIENLKAQRDFDGLIKARAVDQLLDLLNTVEYSMRERAARALCEVGDIAAKPLMQQLDDDDSYAPEVAAFALGILGDKRAVGPLVRTLANRKESVRKAVVETLVKLGKHEWMGVDGRDQLEIINRLKRTRDPHNEEALRKIIRDPKANGNIRRCAEDALADYAKLPCQGPHDWRGCTCSKCGTTREQDHQWNGCKCSECGTTRDQDHRWDRCTCSKCGTTRDQDHRWDGCKCSQCGTTRDQGHQWDGCRCRGCGRVRDSDHNWDNDCDKCSVCGKTRLNAHAWGASSCTTCGQLKLLYEYRRTYDHAATPPPVRTLLPGDSCFVISFDNSSMQREAYRMLSLIPAYRAALTHIECRHSKTTGRHGIVMAPSLDHDQFYRLRDAIRGLGDTSLMAGPGEYGTVLQETR